VPLAALLLGLAYLVLNPTPPCQVVLVTGSSRSEVTECGERKSSIAPSVPYRPAATCAAKPAYGNQWRAVPKPRQRGLEVQILAEQGIGWMLPGLIAGLRATNSEESKDRFRSNRARGGWN